MKPRARLSLIAVCGLLGATALPAQTSLTAAAASDQPLSSIDWLSESLARTPLPRPERRALPQAPGGAVIEGVVVTPLDAPAPDGVGLLGPEETGLPATLWGASTTDDIARRLSDLPPQRVPAVRDALKTVLMARLDPPRGGGTPGRLALARVDALLALGALDPAREILQIAGTTRPELFRRAFDIALLEGREDEGCAVLTASPGIAPSLQVRIFCLARRGDWPAAALTLETAAALGQLSPIEDVLLARFLDAELAEGVAPLPRLPAPTPLEWRMLEAIGERQPTTGLPLAFSHADLRPTSGWKTRIEATERLVRAGALPAEALREVYMERTASASGGAWERVDAIHDLEAALQRGRPRAVARALGRSWTELRGAGLGPAFAVLYSDPLGEVALRGQDAVLAHEIALLGPAYEEAALAPPPGADPVTTALARGLPFAPEGRAPPLHSALTAAFSATPPPPLESTARLMDGDRLGEALIETLRTLAPGAEADPADLSAALAFLRQIGMEDVARRAALQIYLLEARP